MRVLLTGGSGFIAAHVLDGLLEHGHSVVTTVRSQEKANKIKQAHASATKSQLDFEIVEDIAHPGAFANAVKSDPPFEAVIHTASPFHFNTTDIQKDLLDPAVIGTKGVLEAIKTSAPTVKRVVITSSSAAVFDASLGARPGYTYSEKDWSPLTHAEALENNANGYRASKKFAEQAAWDFVEKEKPNFSISVMNPSMVFGPIVNYLNSLSAVNTSNQRVRDMIDGSLASANELPPTGIYGWVDVRDLALAHVKATEVTGAANKRFLIAASTFSNKEILEIIRKNFQELRPKLPAESTPGGTIPDGGVYKIDNSQAVNTLGIQFTSLEKCVIDLVKSLQAVGG